MWTGDVIHAHSSIPCGIRRHESQFQSLRARLGHLGLSWSQGRRSRRRGARLAGDIALLPGQEYRHLHRRQQRGRRDHPRPPRRAARLLSRLSARTWPEKFHNFKIGAAEQGSQTGTDSGGEARGGRPIATVDHYVGDYTDPWYGTIKVRQSGKGLNIDFPHSTGMEGPLTHYQYDTFKTNPTLKWVEPAYVTFSSTPGQDRPSDDEAGLADRRLQLGLSRLAVYAPGRGLI